MRQPTGPSRAAQRIGVLAASLVVVALVTHIGDLAVQGPLDRSGRLKGGDFFEFYALGTLAREGRWNELYDYQAHQQVARQLVFAKLRVGPFVPSYSPLVAAALAPLASLSFGWALAVFSLISMGAYTAGVAVLLRRTAHLRFHWPLVGLCAAAFPGVAVVLRSGQLTAIVWLLIAAAAAAKRPAGGGAVLGILAFKPHLLVPPAAILTIRRCTRWMFWLLLSIGVQAVLAVCIAGIGPVLAYVEALLVLAVRPELIEPFAETDHSIRSLVSAHTAPGGLVVLQALALGLGVGAALFVWFRSPDWRLRWSAAVCAMLVASPHLMTYDLMLLGIPILLVCDWGLDHPRGIDRRALIGVLGLAYMMPIASPPVATATGVQLSVPIMWLLLTLCVVAAKSQETAVVERA